MDFIDQFTFYIALEIVKMDLRESFFELLKVILKRFTAVDFGLSFSQEVEIGPVDDLNIQGKIG